MQNCLVLSLLVIFLWAGHLEIEAVDVNFEENSSSADNQSHDTKPTFGESYTIALNRITSVILLKWNY